MLTGYNQVGVCINRSIRHAKLKGGAESWHLSTLNIADLRRFVYAVCYVKGLEKTRYTTKHDMAVWLIRNGPRLSE